jgi:hypothetical protein
VAGEFGTSGVPNPLSAASGAADGGDDRLGGEAQYEPEKQILEGDRPEVALQATEGSSTTT